MITCRRVYDPPAPGAGVRVLVTTHWPRGVRREAVDRWYKELGTPAALMAPWQNGEMAPADFRDAYLTAMQAPAARAALAELTALAAAGPVTLLTSFRDLERSHSHILKEMIEAALAGET